jgi:hypothetical protein
MINEYGLGIYQQVKEGKHLSVQYNVKHLGGETPKSYPVNNENDFVRALLDIRDNNVSDLDISVFMVYESSGKWYRNEFHLVDCLQNVTTIRPRWFR